MCKSHNIEVRTEFRLVSVVTIGSGTSLGSRKLCQTGLRIRIRIISGSWIRIHFKSEKMDPKSALQSKFRSFRGSKWSRGSPQWKRDNSKWSPRGSV